MATIAFVPLRGGSRSIPNKNIKLIAGRPLVSWCLESLENSLQIDQIIVATESAEIKKTVLGFGFKKVSIYDRDPENATDTSATESVMLEYISKHKLKPTSLFVLVQATNPFTTAADIDQAIQIFKKSKTARSLLSVVRTKRFLWDLKNRPINYNPTKRPRRQDYEGLQLENGAFYVSTVQAIVKSKNRLSHPILTYEMAEHSGYEIDEVDDWIICEKLLMQHRPLRRDYSKIKLLLTDIDGVLTDAGMYYTENGDEIKKFNTYDGMALKLIQKMGIKVGFLTAEDRDLNRNRAKKLGVDFEIHGCKDKLKAAMNLVKQVGFTLNEVAYVGDDLNDITLLEKVGFAFCPANAQSEVMELNQVHKLQTSGGSGVIREIYNFIKK